MSALHFYEAKGLITSRRTEGNQRRFSRDTLRRVAFIRAAQRVGIPLATIRSALAELPEERTPTREDWARLSEAWRAELDERITQLNRLRDHLTDCIGCGCLSLDTCVLPNPDDKFGERGAGSRLMAEGRLTQGSAARVRTRTRSLVLRAALAGQIRRTHRLRDRAAAGHSAVPRAARLAVTDRARHLRAGMVIQPPRQRYSPRRCCRARSQPFGTTSLHETASPVVARFVLTH